MKKKLSNKERAKQQAQKDMKCEGITCIVPIKREFNNGILPMLTYLN